MKRICSPTTTRTCASTCTACCPIAGASSLSGRTSGARGRETSRAGAGHRRRDDAGARWLRAPEGAAGGPGNGPSPGHPAVGARRRGGAHRRPAGGRLRLSRQALLGARAARAGRRADPARRDRGPRRRRTRGDLPSVFGQAPVAIAILRGPDHTYEFANDPYLELVAAPAVLGKPILEALPELADQGIKELLDEVRSSGKPFASSSRRVLLNRAADGTAEEAFFKLVYQPLIDGDGQSNGDRRGRHRRDRARQRTPRRRKRESCEGRVHRHARATSCAIRSRRS